MNGSDILRKESDIPQRSIRVIFTTFVQQNWAMLSFNKQIKIQDSLISPDTKSFIIAEAGVNHNGEMELAKQLVDIAFEAQADAVKFQSFKTESLILK